MGFFSGLFRRPAAGGLALLARLTRGSRHRRLWLILGGAILLPVAVNFQDNPYSISPVWFGVAMGLIYDPGAVFRLKNIVPFVQYFGGGAVVTAIGLYIIDKFRKSAGLYGKANVADSEDPTNVNGDNA